MHMFLQSAAIWLYTAKALSTRVQPLTVPDEHLPGSSSDMISRHMSYIKAFHVVSEMRAYAEI